MVKNTLWHALLGVIAAIAGIFLVEAMVAVGGQPLAPIGWPSLFLLLATAFGGFATLGGGALAVGPYFALNFAAPERFPAFYANPSMPWVWVVAFSLLGVVTALLRERVARVSEAPFRAVTENLGALVSYVDADAHFRFNNRLYESWFGLPRAQITGRPMREVLGEESYARVEPFVMRALAGERVEFEVELRRGGSVRHLHGIYVPDLRAGRRVAGFYGIVTDISRLKVAEQELTLLAHYDSLTGAMNRALFIERLDQAAARGRRTGDLPVLLYLDIDRFKAVNDLHGHDAGDALLKEFVARLRRCLRETDAVGRLGGDEFLLLLERVKGEANAAAVAQKILDAMQEPIGAYGHELVSTTSIGIAVYDGQMSVEAWIKSADEALYEAKNAGRNTFRTAAA
jgi:diguanylate cyclase (GGDEF)-like protein/PAS domain S-box-containing protein